MEAGACSLLLDEMARSHESDDVGTSRVVVRQSVSSGGGTESVTDSLSGVMPTGPIASTSARDDGEINSENNGGAGVGSDTQTLSSLQATVKLLSDQMAWFVDNSRNQRPNWTVS